jgi:RecA/RadA recombinase
MNEFLSDFVKESGNQYANVVRDGLEGADVDGFVDTGSYAFNALLSGSVWGGIPNNKIIAIAGESATGKTYFTLGIVHKFLSDNPSGVVLYFDTEQAVTSSMFTDRGVDPERVAVFPVATIEDFRHQAIKIVDKYLELPKSERKPMLICLDSLGMLSTDKEIVDTAEGKGTRDMTRAQMIKSTFRVLTIKLGKAGIPLILTNHTYDVIGSMFPQKEMGGGSGLKYAASTIVYLSKKKLKEGTDVIGNIIHCKLYKSRFTKENSMIDVMLNYDEGLNPYYGLIDLALKYDLVSKVSNRIQFKDGTKVYEKQIYKNPKKYFTDDFMQELDRVAQKEFRYGTDDKIHHNERIEEEND